MSDSKKKKETDEPKVTLEQLKQLPKEDMLQLAYDTIAELTDNDPEIIRAANYNDQDLLRVFNKASGYHNKIAAAKKIAEDIDHQKTSSDIFWVVWAMKLEIRIQTAEQGLSRLSQAINTRAMLRNNGGMR